MDFLGGFYSLVLLLPKLLNDCSDSADWMDLKVLSATVGMMTAVILRMDELLLYALLVYL